MLRLNSLLIFFTLLSYISPFVSPQKMSFLMFMGLLYPYFIIFNIIFIFIWRVSKYKHWRLSALCLIIGMYYFTRILGIHFFQEKPRGNVLKILDYNINGYSLKNFKNWAAGFNSLENYMNSENPDIICFQESSRADFYERVMNTTTVLKKYPYYFHTEESETAIFSKYPITATKSFPINNNKENGCVSADIKINDKIIRFYSLQLQSNEISSMADNIAEKGIKTESGWINILKIMNRFRKAGRKRTNEAEIIAADIQQSPHPVVVCGDFNDIPVSYSYQTLSSSKNLKDAFQEAGCGLSVTYAGNIPGLRIDFILLDKKFKVFNCHVNKVPYSDHYPVVSEIRF